MRSFVFCVLSFASAKERYQRKAARETFLARKVSRDSSKEGWGNFAFEAKLLPHGWKYVITLTPSVRASADFTGWLLFLRFRHGVGIEGMCSEGML